MAEELSKSEMLYQRTRYQAANAYWMARISGEVYEKTASGGPDHKAILSTLASSDERYIQVLPYNKNSTQACVIEHKRYIVLAFRGTDELADWWDNIQALPKDTKLGEVHSGFHNALLDVWPDMFSAAKKLHRQLARPIWITGHSLGGALATLAAAEMIVEDSPFYGLYTFGAPRAGGREFARRFNVEAAARTFRFQNNNDIVTRVPARVMGYSHVGSFRYIDSEKRIHSDAGFWYQFLDGLRGIASDFGDEDIDHIEDHKIGHYLAGIENWGNQEPLV